MTVWLEKLAGVTASTDAAILVTVLETKGSIPRGSGTKMVVTAEDCFGTVGGGNLEYQCIAMAQERLSQNSAQAWRRMVHRFPLGARLGQCCGGLVVMLLEYIDSESAQWAKQLQALNNAQQEALLVTPLHDESTKFLIGLGEDSKALLADKDNYFVEECAPASLHIMLFGAGHVGRALVNVLASIECTISWVDSRAEQFPATLPANTRRVVADEPSDEVDEAPANTCFLVMTHSHQLDQQICEKVLQRTDVKFCGLIGSLTKKRKFEQRLQARGFSDSVIAQLTCPIGIPGITGKEPGVIAVSVVAQLLTLFD